MRQSDKDKDVFSVVVSSLLELVSSHQQQQQKIQNKTQYREGRGDIIGKKKGLSRSGKRLKEDNQGGSEYDHSTFYKVYNGERKLLKTFPKQPCLGVEYDHFRNQSSHPLETKSGNWVLAVYKVCLVGN